MSTFEDDDDEFLYGSEVPSAKRQKTTSAKDEDEALVEAETDSAPAASTAAAAVEADDYDPEQVGNDDGEEGEGEGEDEDEEEEDDESDIEFVIDTKPGQKAEAPSKHAPYSTSKTTTTTTAPATDGGSEPTATSAAKENQKTTGEKPPGIDINAVAEHNGRPITEISLEELEDKPWRKPGADVTDYFNYGFDEFTWTAYCSKQDNLRESFTPQKIMAMVGLPVFPPEMMAFNQGFPGMPGMPGMPPPPGMGGQFPPPPPGFLGMGNDDNGAYGNSNIVTGGNNYRRK